MDSFSTAIQFDVSALKTDLPIWVSWDKCKTFLWNEKTFKKSKTRKVHSLRGKKKEPHLLKKLLVEDSGHENAIRPNPMKMHTQHNFGHPLAELFSALFFSGQRCLGNGMEMIYCWIKTHMTQITSYHWMRKNNSGTMANFF